jgi:hypothetical protein
VSLKPASLKLSLKPASQAFSRLYLKISLKPASLKPSLKLYLKIYLKILSQARLSSLLALCLNPSLKPVGRAGRPGERRKNPFRAFGDLV